MIYQIIINTVNIFTQIMQIFSRIIFMLIIFLSNIFHMFIHSFVPYSKIYSLFILCYETFKTLVNHHGIASDFQAWGKFQKFKCLLPWLIREQFSGNTKWENVNKNGKWGTLFSSTFLTILRFKLCLVENPGIGMSWHQRDQSSVNGELVNWAFKAHIFHFWNCIYKVHLPRILCFIHSLWNWPVPSLLQEMRHYYSDQVTS